jgi:hypothetical protein
MKKRMTLLSITALAVLVAPGLVRNASADVRVSATVRTPIVTVRVGNTPFSHHRSFARKPLPVIYVQRHVIITRDDRRIAARLAQYTGVPAQDMLYLKSRGYTWYQIGRWIDVSDCALQAAMNNGTWNRFIHSRHFDRCNVCNDDGPGRRYDRDRSGRVIVVNRGYDDCNRR